MTEILQHFAVFLFGNSSILGNGPVLVYAIGGGLLLGISTSVLVDKLSISDSYMFIKSIVSTLVAVVISLLPVSLVTVHSNLFVDCYYSTKTFETSEYNFDVSIKKCKTRETLDAEWSEYIFRDATVVSNTEEK